MSQHVAAHQGVVVEPGRGGAGTTWLTRGQLVLRGLQLGSLVGLVLGSLDTFAFLERNAGGHNLLVGALVLTAGALAANLLACVGLNRLVPPEDAARRGRRLVLSWLLEGALIPMSYLPLVMVLLIGPPVLRVMDALTRS